MAQTLVDKGSASTYLEPTLRPITRVKADAAYQSGEGAHRVSAFTVDKETGAVYFRLKPTHAEIVKSIPLDTLVVLDVDKKGEVVGLELLARKEMLDALLLTLKKSGYES